MKKLLILAALMMLAMPAFAAVQNVKVSGDIETFGVYQDEFDLTTGDTTAKDDHGFITTITRLRVDSDLTDNVAATIRLLNERIWGVECTSTGTNTVTIDLAYLTLKDMFYSPMTLKIGRQDLRYGSGLIVGDPDTNAASVGGLSSYAPFLSKRKSFDAIRAILDYDPWTVDLVYAKVDEVHEAAGEEDVDLYGVNFAYDFADYDAESEIYYFYLDGPAKADAGASAQLISPNAVDAGVIGVRGSLVPVDGLDLRGEVAYQHGKYLDAPTVSDSDRKLRAWAASAEGSFAFDNEYAPVLRAGYDYRSGNKATATSGKYKAWLPMFEDQTKGMIADYLLAGVNGGITSNAHIFNLGGSMKPAEDITLSVDWFHYRLAQALTTASESSIDVWSNLKGVTYTNKKTLGNEIDACMTYDYTEDVQFGLKGGVFMPGKVFDAPASSTKNNKNAYTLIGSVGVSF